MIKEKKNVANYYLCNVFKNVAKIDSHFQTIKRIEKGGKYIERWGVEGGARMNNDRGGDGQQIFIHVGTFN